MEYFYIENNSQKGPVSVDELVRHITLDTSVWCAGMSNWAPASTVPELAAALAARQPYQDGWQESPQCQYQQQSAAYAQKAGGGYPSSQYAQNASTYQVGNPNQNKPDNYLVWAIVTTVLCCMPLGVVSIVFSFKVDSLWLQGQYEESRKASDNAKKFAILSAIIAAVFYVIYFAVIFRSAALKM